MPFDPQNSSLHPTNNNGLVEKTNPLQGVPVIQIAGAVVLLGGGYLLSKKLGLVKDAANVKNQSTILTMPQFTTTWLDDETKRHPTGAQVTKVWTDYNKIKPVADNIFNSKGVFKDDKDLFWSQIKLMDSQVALWQVAKVFKQLYGKDIGSFIGTLLTTDEQQRFIDMINKLPSGFTS